MYDFHDGMIIAQWLLTMYMLDLAERPDTYRDYLDILNTGAPNAGTSTYEAPLGNPNDSR
jgi:hypothetical protein